MTFLIIFFLLTGICYGQEINEKYSYDNFCNQYFTNAEEFNDTIIVGSSFGIENKPYSKIFPKGMTGVIFRMCNITNAVVPPGNTIEGGCYDQILLQKDNEYWIVDEDLKPIRPHKEDRFDKWKISKDPKDIPLVMSEEPITFIKEREYEAIIISR